MNDPDDKPADKNAGANAMQKVKDSGIAPDGSTVLSPDGAPQPPPADTEPDDPAD